MSDVRTCALLAPVAAQPPAKDLSPPPAPREDESADPVGDGHSDAELAERLRKPPPHKPDSAT